MLKIAGVCKDFRATKALSNVDFSLEHGEVHVLFGENGAGKSTLANVITGNLRPDRGSIQIDGTEVGGLDPATARSLGIAAVFQEFSLVPALNVLDNLFLGREITARGIRSRKAMRERASAVAADLGFVLDMDAVVGDLSRAHQQMVEIVKALIADPKILILDEPTASLTDSEANNLIRAIKGLRARGVGLIYISHRIREIQELADRVTVLRSGTLIGTILRSEISEATLVSMMTGRGIDELFPAIPHAPGEVACRLAGVTTRNGAVANVSLHVRAGEIVGIAGLVGCGKSEVGQALFGLDPIRGGHVELNGRRLHPRHPRQMQRAGLCYFPADRGKEGLALERSILSNVTMASLDLDRFTRWGWLRKRRERQQALEAAERLAVRPLDLDKPVAALSGGNRQKVMLARGLLRDLNVFVFDEPTVGIDVGAKVEVYRFMQGLVARGAAVLLISSELPEVLALSHRIYVMHDGGIVTELADRDRTQENALHAFFGKPRLAVLEAAQ